MGKQRVFGYCQDSGSQSYSIWCSKQSYCSSKWLFWLSSNNGSVRKDIAALSDNERDGAILSFTQWLSGTPFDTQIQSTTLPTNTRIQIEELVRIQEQVRYDLLDPDLTDKERWQLNQRADILATHILQLEVVAAVQYNTEFFIWIFGDTLEELESYTRLASSVSYGFRPHVVSVSKKDQILKQYYNYNESV